MSSPNQQFSESPLSKAIGVAQIGCIAASTAMSHSGLKKILPSSDGFMSEFWAATACAGMFCSMYILWQSQKMLFVRLGTKSRKAIVAHIGAAVLMLGLSPPTNYIAQVTERAAVRDMHFAQKRAEEKGMEAVSSFHSAANIVHFINSTATKMDGLAVSAERGDLTGISGRGNVWKRYISYRDQLHALSSMIQDAEAEVEELMQRSDIVLGTMRKATENDLPLDTQVIAFEAAYRDFGNIYAKLVTLNIHKLIETSLLRLQDSAVVTGSGVKNSTQALKLADKQARKLVNDIIEYVTSNATHLNPLPAYKLDSPSIVSFRYWRDYIPQLCLSIALDMSFLVTLWLLIALREYEEDEGSDNNTFNLKQLETLASALQAINKAGKDERDD